MRTLGGKRLAILLLALTPVIPVQAAEDDSLWDKVKDQGTKWYEDAKDKAPEVYDDLKEKGGELYDKAKEKAPELKDKATEKLGEAQQNVQEFRENQEAEFWQGFEEQVGAPVGPNSVQTTEHVEPKTTSETTAESSTVSEYGHTIPETVVDTVLEDPQAVSSVENHSGGESNSQSSSTLSPIIAITTIAANLVGTVAMIIVSIMLVRRMPRKTKH